MSQSFFDHPILNSPYEPPTRYHALDEDGQPLEQPPIEGRRPCDFITPVPKPKRRSSKAAQASMVFDDASGLSDDDQEYNPKPIINEIRAHVTTWRNLSSDRDWGVTPATARLLHHWRRTEVEGLRPFFCQVEAVETVIWLTEVARTQKRYAHLWKHIEGANRASSPELMRIAMKMATGAGKTTVMAMLIAWQTVNAVRSPTSSHFSRGFLIVALGITIKDRLRVLLPDDPESYYRHRDLVPSDMMPEIAKAKVVITNYHSFKRRETMDVSKVGKALLQGRGDAPTTIESEGQMLQRACGDLMTMKNVVVILRGCRNRAISACHGAQPTLAPIDAQNAAIERAMADLRYTELPLRFVTAEWRQIVDAWNLPDLESYTSVPRIGRRNRLGSKQRDALWPVFETARAALAGRGFLTSSQLFAAVEANFNTKDEKPFTHVIVDEAQDLGVSELRMMGAISSGPNSQFFAGDIGQRIFQLPFSWLALGVDVRGRASSLRINYRTSRQIREASDQLLPQKVRDVDGIEDDRTGAQSVFEGPAPVIARCADEAEETANVAAYLRAAIEEGISAAEIGVFVRSTEYLSRAREAVAAAGLEARQLTERAEDFGDCVSLGTMHLAKGLEFKAVVVMACDDEALPLQSRVDAANDEDELREIFDTERHLFYVACTRARDRLHISGIKPASEFLGDIRVSRA